MWKITNTEEHHINYKNPKINLKPTPHMMRLKGNKKFKGTQTNIPGFKIKGTETFYTQTTPKDIKFLEVYNMQPTTEIKCYILYFDII